MTTGAIYTTAQQCEAVIFRPRRRAVGPCAAPRFPWLAFERTNAPDLHRSGAFVRFRPERKEDAHFNKRSSMRFSHTPYEPCATPTLAPSAPGLRTLTWRTEHHRHPYCGLGARLPCSLTLPRSSGSLHRAPGGDDVLVHGAIVYFGLYRPRIVRQSHPR